jgi:hypothetical protein
MYPNMDPHFLESLQLRRVINTGVNKTMRAIKVETTINMAKV